MGKNKKNKKFGNAFRNNPMARNSLADQITSEKFETANSDDELMEEPEESTDPEFTDKKTTQRILKQARLQQQQLENELSELDVSKKPTVASTSHSITLGSSGTGDTDDEDELQGPTEDDSKAIQDKFDKELELDPDDEVAILRFMNKNAEPARRLGDVLMEKLTEKRTEIETICSDAGVVTQKLDPRVEKMYEGVKEVLQRYRSGKLPKAFKLIPRISNWEQILYITDPNGWTAAAMYQATRIFASNLKEKMAQRFFNLVLLPRVRDDIAEYKKLNFHLYQALRKALFKPGAFMKGILIPLCESGDCTLREAIIIGSVIAKNSIPLLHSSAAMLKIAEMDYSGANSIFLRVLLEKKYALPYRVIDAVVYHFLKFQTDKRLLPVLWHQCLLVFAKMYKDHMSSEQKEALHALLRVHLHQQITPEIRRELMNSKSRDSVVEETMEPNSLPDQIMKPKL